MVPSVDRPASFGHRFSVTVTPLGKNGLMVALIAPNITAAPRRRPARALAHPPAGRPRTAPVERHLQVVAAPKSAALGAFWEQRAGALRMILLAVVVASSLIGIRVAQGSLSTNDAPASPSVGIESSNSDIVLSVANES